MAAPDPGSGGTLPQPGNDPNIATPPPQEDAPHAAREHPDSDRDGPVSGP